MGAGDGRDAPDQPPERVGSFVVEGVLGRGGMGVVYRALDPRLNRRVAVKVLSPSVRGDAQRTMRLLREARAAAAVAHPHIATVYEVGVDAAGDVFVALELVEGRSLRDVLLAGPLPVEAVVPLACEMTSAVARAHKAGLIHRDLKPENVMIDGEGHAKILDFGLAKELAPSELAQTGLTQDGTPVGTPGYMAPEQVRGQTDARSDVFALGVMFFEMLAGHRPFGGDTVFAAMLAVVDEEPRTLPEGVPADIAALVRRMIARAPDDRPADASVVLEALAPWRAQPTPRSAPPRVTVGPMETREAPEARAVATAAPRWRSTSRGTLAVLGAVAVGTLTVAGLWGLLRHGAGGTPRGVGRGAAAAPPRVRVGRDEPVTGWLAGAGLVAVVPEGPRSLLAQRNRRVVRIRRDTGVETVVAEVEGTLVGAEGDRLLVLGAEELDGGDLSWQDGGGAGPPIARQVLAAALGPPGIAVLRPDALVQLDRAGREVAVLAPRSVMGGALAWFPSRPCVAATVIDGRGLVLLVVCTDGTNQVLATGRSLVSATGLSGVLAPRDDLVLYVRSTRAGESDAELVAQRLRGNEPLGPPRVVHTWPTASASALAYDGEHVLYARTTTSRDVYALDLDADSPVPRAIVTNDAPDMLGSVARDGSLLFQSRRGTSRDIYRARVDAPDEEPLLTDPAWDEEAPVAFRDSILYLRRPLPREGELRPWELMRHDVGGSDTTLLAGEGAPGPTEGLPRVVCASAADRCIAAIAGHASTKVAELDPTRRDAIRTLYRWTRSEVLRRPAISADGTRVALVPNTSRSVLWLDVATGSVTEWQLSEASEQTLQFGAISPRDGRLAVTTLQPPYRSGVAWLEPSGALVPIITSDDTWWADPFFSPDGRWLALTGMRLDSDVWSLALTFE